MGILNHYNTTVSTPTGFLQIDRDMVSIEEFLESNCVHCQRLEEPRIEKLTSILLERLLPTHLEVAYVMAHFTDEFYQQNIIYSVDANTRKIIWSYDEDLRPKVGLYRRIYHAYSKEDVEAIYRSIDSQDSVEKTAHLLSGILRYFKVDIIDKKIKKGDFVNAIKIAYNNIHGKTKDIETKIEKKKTDIPYKTEVNEFIHQLVYLGNEVFPLLKGNKRNKFSSNNIMASFLMLLKKYNHEPSMLNKVKEGISILISEKSIVNEGDNLPKDGITVIWKDIHYKYNLTTSWSSGSISVHPVVVGDILYAFESYLEDRLITTKKDGTCLTPSKAKKYYESFWSKY